MAYLSCSAGRTHFARTKLFEVVAPLYWLQGATAEHRVAPIKYLEGTTWWLHLTNWREPLVAPCSHLSGATILLGWLPPAKPNNKSQYKVGKGLLNNFCFKLLTIKSQLSLNYFWYEIEILSTCTCTTIIELFLASRVCHEAKKVTRNIGPIFFCWLNMY